MKEDTRQMVKEDVTKNVDADADTAPDCGAGIRGDAALRQDGRALVFCLLVDVEALRAVELVIAPTTGQKFAVCLCRALAGACGCQW